MNIHEPQDADGKQEFQRLSLLFRRAKTLAPLPSTATKLISVIDSGEASARDLEKIIEADPSVATLLMSLTAMGGLGSGSATIRQAILKLGQKTIRSVAVSLTLKSMSRAREMDLVCPGPQFSKHSLAVAFVCRYLMARSYRLNGSLATTWSADEVFAAGLLHDIPVLVLAFVAPEVLQRTVFMAKRLKISIHAAFQKLTGLNLHRLGSEAAKSWNLPEVFAISLHYFSDPWNCVEEFDGLAAIIYANWVVDNSFGYRIEEQSLQEEPLADVSAIFTLSDQEICLLKQAVDSQLATFDQISLVA